jgi:hypothetical protein
MPQPVQLQEMRVAIREIADEEELQQDRISPEELDRRINRALRRLYNKLVRAGGHERYAKEHEIVTVADVDTYALPQDFGLHLLGVLGQDDSTYSWADLPAWTHNDIARLSSQHWLSGVLSLRHLHYRIQNNALVLKPVPRRAYTLHVRYVPQFQPLAGDADTFDGVNGWEEWAYYTVALGLVDKDEQDPRRLERERAMIEAEIADLAANRDAGNPEIVQDTRKDGWTHGQGLWPYGHWGP